MTEPSERTLNPWNTDDDVRRVVLDIVEGDSGAKATPPAIGAAVAKLWGIDDYDDDPAAKKRVDQRVRTVVKRLLALGELARDDLGADDDRRTHWLIVPTERGKVVDRLRRKECGGDGSRYRLFMPEGGVERPEPEAPAAPADEETRAVELADELSSLYGLPSAAVTTVDKVPGYRLAVSLDTLEKIVSRTKIDRAELADRDGRLERLENRVRELRKQVDEAAAQQGERPFAATDETLLDRCASVASELFAAATDVSSPDELFELAGHIGKAAKRLSAEGWESRR